MLVSIKPLNVSVFFLRPSSGDPPLCFVPLLFLPLICVRWVRITQYVICVCLVFLSVGDLRIQTQQTQISGRNSNGTKHSGGPPEDGRKKKTETCRGFILTNRFLTFYWFWMLKWVCFKVWIVHELDCITSPTAVSPHSLEIGHMFIWTDLLGIVHTTNS